MSILGDKQFGVEVAKHLDQERKKLTEWQPIETAPKDGKDILVFLDGKGEDFSRVAVVYWRNNGFREFAWDCLIHRPTHWMPLPAWPEGK